MAFENLGKYALVVGRLAIAILFLHEVWFKLTHYELTLSYMQRFGVPGWTLPGAIAVQLLGGLALLTGIGARYAALALSGFCVITPLIFHMNWASQNEILHFEKDIAIAGGLLILAMCTSGPLSFRFWNPN